MRNLLVGKPKAVVRYHHKDNMKRLNNIYHRVHNMNNLYVAFMASRKGKRYKKEVINFESSIGSNLFRLSRELSNKEYKPGSHYVFTVKEPKERVIMVPPFRDRVVHHCLCDNILEPIFERNYVNSNFANRRGKGTHAALSVLRSQMHKLHMSSSSGYILKCDISKYFYSINHDVLKFKIRRLIKDKDVLWLTDKIIDSTPNNVGIPIGNLTSQLFANYYLSEMDHIIKEKLKIKHYVRYMDDFTLMYKDKEYLTYCKNYLTDYLKTIGLSFNQKTQVFPLKNGIDFLGFHTYITNTGKTIMRLRKQSIKKMKRKLKYFQRGYREGLLSLGDIRLSVASWVGHAKHGNTYNLRKKILDRYYYTKESDYK